jgi:hypothetical protein
MVYQTFKSLTKPKSYNELPEQSAKRLTLTYDIIENYTPTQHSQHLPSHNNSNNNNNNNNNSTNVNSNKNNCNNTNLLPQKVSLPTRNEQKPTKHIFNEIINNTNTNTNTNTNVNKINSSDGREVKSESIKESLDSDGPLPVLEFQPEELEKVLQQFTENANVTEVTSSSEELNRLLEYDTHSHFGIFSVCFFSFFFCLSKRWK